MWQRDVVMGENERIWGCENAYMWEHEDVGMWECDNQKIRECENENGGPMSSKTSEATIYKDIKIGNYKINIIDTPGFADSRGTK